MPPRVVDQNLVANLKRRDGAGSGVQRDLAGERGGVGREVGHTARRLRLSHALTRGGGRLLLPNMKSGFDGAAGPQEVQVFERRHVNGPMVGGVVRVRGAFEGAGPEVGGGLRERCTHLREQGPMNPFRLALRGRVESGRNMPMDVLPLAEGGEVAREV